MKHVKLFESFNISEQRTPELFDISPEEFAAEVDKSIAMNDPVAAHKYIKAIMSSDRGRVIKADVKKGYQDSITKFHRHYLAPMSHVARYQFLKEVNPEKYAEQAAKVPGEKDLMKIAILDKYKSGEITAEEALKHLS